jgi:hypothetical protein
VPKGGYGTRLTPLAPLREDRPERNQPSLFLHNLNIWTINY